MAAAALRTAASGETAGVATTSTNFENAINATLNLGGSADDVQHVLVLATSKMGHFLNRTLFDNQVAFTSSLRPLL